jgi:multidrug efflux pump subunit AcrB
VADGVRAKVEGIRASHPDVTITEVTSSTGWLVESYDAAIEALWVGALLAVLVVWMFLRDLRATFLSSVALPLSLIPTFAVMVMYALNQSLNNITLLAIALVVGILVDDAIVEIENIVRHMREKGKTAYDAAMEAADEIGFAVVATTFTIVAVFLPVAFMGGIPGQFFRAFAIAVCCSVLFSLLVACMLTPLMGAYLLRAGGYEEDTPFWMSAYLAVLRRALRHRWLTLGLGLAFFAGSMAMAPFIPTGDIERMQELTSNFALAMGSGVVLVYLVLVLLFQGFLQPVTILTALPLSFGGAFALLLVTSSSFSMSALIGLLRLMGIAAKNSILLVEYAITARQTEGLPRAEAMIDAAAKRARPILMTTIAMVAGMLPIVLGLGADAETRAPMAIAVIGGLVSSTLLSLLYVPAIYLLIDDLEQWMGRHLGRFLNVGDVKAPPQRLRLRIKNSISIRRRSMSRWDARAR